MSLRIVLSMEKKEIIVVTNPMIAANRSAEVTLSKFLRVIKPSVKSIEVIGGNLSVEKDLSDVVLTSFPIIRYPNKLKRMLAVVGVQFKMMKSIIHDGKKNQPVYFWIADKMILPYFAAKLKKMEVNYFIYGNVEKEGVKSKFTELSGRLIRYMASHADYVCMESPSVDNEWPQLTIEKKKTIHLYTEVENQLSFENRDTVLGMVCRLTPGKHVLECIQAMAELHSKYPQWTLEIIGSGKQQVECEELIKKKNAENYIRMLGWVEHSELFGYVKRWKYLLFPTDTEGMPNGLIEMMGSGIPAIASPVGGIADVVESRNGFLIQGYSVNDIKGEMEEAILTDEDLYQSMAKNAYNKIKGEFTLSAAQMRAREMVMR